MRLAIFSDSHFHNWATFSTIDGNGINSRLAQTAQRVRDILTYAEENCDAVVFAGDLFHVKKIDAETIDVAVRAFQGFDIPIVGVAGNHDMANVEQHIYSARALSKHIEWLDRHNGFEVTISGVRFYGIPYMTDREQLYKQIAEANKPDVLILHCGFAGCRLGADYIADLDNFVDPTRLAGMAGLIVAGHFHSPQVMSIVGAPVAGAEPSQFLISEGGTILIPGAPEQHNIGDAGDERGFMTADLTAGLAQFHPLDSPKFMDLKGDFDAAKIAGSYAVYRGPEDKSVELKLAEVSKSYIYVPQKVAIVKQVRDELISESNTPVSVLSRYVETAETPLDKKRLLELGKAMLT